MGLPALADAGLHCQAALPDTLAQGHYWGCQGREAGSQSRALSEMRLLTQLTGVRGHRPGTCGVRGSTQPRSPAQGTGARRCRARTVSVACRARAAAHSHAQPARGMGCVGAGHSPSSVDAGAPILPIRRNRHAFLDAGAVELGDLRGWAAQSACSFRRQLSYSPPHVGHLSHLHTAVISPRYTQGDLYLL